MPKSASEPETVVPARLSRKLRWVQERTREAVEYYKTKKEDLKSAKLKYLQKIGEAEERPARRRPKDQQQEEKPPQLRRLARAGQRIYREESESDVAAEYMAEEARSSPSEDSLSSEPRYELKGVHLAALEVQRLVDSCLDFHFSSRGRRCLSRAELLTYLQTTKYALNCDRYLAILALYNRHAYRWEEGRVLCREFSGEEMEARVEATRERMRRKRAEELLL